LSPQGETRSALPRAAAAVPASGGHRTPARKAAPAAQVARPRSRQVVAIARAPSIAQEIGRRISAVSKANPGRVHTPFDFLDLGSPHSVDMALMRLVRRPNAPSKVATKALPRRKLAA